VCMVLHKIGRKSAIIGLILWCAPEILMTTKPIGRGN
jgi:hypothetical protein